MISILIVDDDPVVRQTLPMYFQQTEDITVAGTADTGVSALEFLDDNEVDLVLADIHMPEMDGVTLLRNLQTKPNPPQFVAMTGIDTDKSMLQVLSTGGAGYMVKSARPAEMIDAVRDAMNGGTSVSPHCLSRLLDYLPAASKTAPTVTGKEIELTPTEHRILTLLCTGMSNAEIAKESGYAEPTVKKHISNLIKYFGADSRLSLAVIALRGGY